MSEVKLFAFDGSVFSARAASLVFLKLQQLLAEARRVSVALSGGSTPGFIFDELVSLLGKEEVKRLDFFWVDERHVPHDDDASNYRLAKERLFDPLGLDESQIYPFDFIEDPLDSASSYSSKIAGYFERNSCSHIDLLLLGMGADGHTASLFPGDLGWLQREEFAISTTKPETGEARLSLSVPTIKNAGDRLLFFTGAGKLEALLHLFDETAQSKLQELPARLVWHSPASIVIDTELAQALSKEKPELEASFLSEVE